MTLGGLFEKKKEGSLMIDSLKYSKLTLRDKMVEGFLFTISLLLLPLLLLILEIDFHYVAQLA